MTGLEPAADRFRDESYEELYEHAPCGFLSVVLGGTVVRVNETLLRWTGYSRSQVVGSPVSVLLSAGSQLFYETRLEPVLRLEGEAHEIALEMRRADGTALHVLTNSTVVRATHGEAALVRIAVFDSTERRSYERDLLDARRLAESSEARVRVLQDAASAFAQSDSVLAVAEALAQSARNAFAASEVAVLFLGEDGTLKVVAGAHPMLGHLSEGQFAPGFEAISAGNMFTLSNLDDAAAFSPEVAEAMRLARVEALTSTPIQSESGLFGVVTCFFGRSREFDPAYRQLNEALARQGSQVIGRLMLQEQLAREALHDQLTGLANRTLLRERLDEAIAGGQRSGAPLAVLFVDLDGFKAVNDHLGHVVGDSALREVAGRLRDHVRATDVVGRFGGDEFIVVCADADEDASMAVAERIRASIALPLADVSTQDRVTASIGIALWEPAGTAVDADTLFRVADEAMYRCKNAGKDCVTLVRV
jgi:diguanylate cyclase (GGDEF)-like protein/PAS domain S-box-containing protein